MLNAWLRDQVALKIRTRMTQMNALGTSFKDFFHDFFFCLRVAPAFRVPAAEVKYLAVFQVFNHPRDRFLACCSNSTLEMQ